MINENGMKSQADFDYWINLALGFKKKSKILEEEEITQSTTAASQLGRFSALKGWLW
jgi:hypothetical protein